MWKPWTAWAALLLGFAGALAGARALGIAASAGGASLDDPPGWVNIAATAVQDLSLIAGAVFFARLPGRARAEDFGLRATAVGRGIGLAIVCVVAFFLFTLVWVLITGAHEPATKLLDELHVRESTLSVIAVAALVCVVAPFAEEFVFRGYFFTAMRGWRGMGPAAVVTGIAFGAIHLGSTSVVFLVPLAFFGFALCILYDRTGSLYPGIAAHAVNNAIAFGSSEHWGWQIPVVAAGSLALIAAAGLTISRLQPASPSSG